MRLIIGLAAGIAVSSAAAARSPEWDVYNNTPHAYAVCYPPHILHAGRESDSGDGKVFKASDGAEMTVYGYYDVLEEGLRRHLRSLVNDTHGRITYRAKGRNWAVASVIGARQAFYIKAFSSRDGELVTLKIDYPRQKADFYRPIIARISQCFQLLPRAY
jgi:hypothetical protein